MTKVGPLLPMGDACGFEEEEPVVEATTSGKHAGGLGEDDLNLLSSMESNSANCSMVLEDMDLTIVCPILVVVVEPFSELLDELDWLVAVLVTTDCTATPEKKNHQIKWIFTLYQKYSSLIQKLISGAT